jgi:hypothetical protein
VHVRLHAEKSNVYKSILCATKVIDDFPRNELEDHRKAMLRLKPAFYSTEPDSSLNWISENPLNALFNAQASLDKGPLVTVDTASSSTNPHPQVRHDHLSSLW